MTATRAILLVVLFLSCTNDLETKYSSTTPGELLLVVPSDGKPSPMFERASRLVVKDTLIFVVDAAAGTVHSFTTNGTFLASYGKRGAGPGELLQVGGLVTVGDTLLIGDNRSKKIELYSLSSHQHIGTWQIPGNLLSFALTSPQNVITINISSAPLLTKYADGAAEELRTLLPNVHGGNGNPLVRVARYRITPDIDEDFLLADLLHGHVWSVSGDGTSSDLLLDEADIPPEMKEERSRLFKSLNRPGMFVPLYRNVHAVPGGGAWLDVPWGRILGILVSADSTAQQVLVTSSARDEHRQLVDSAIGMGRLYLLYPTRLEIYDLRLP